MTFKDIDHIQRPPSQLTHENYRSHLTTISIIYSRSYISSLQSNEKFSLQATSNFIQERFLKVNKSQYALCYWLCSPECMLGDIICEWTQNGGSADRESIRNVVRACIRKEQNNYQGTQTLVNRTRNLTRESASFAGRNLSAGEVFNFCLRIEIPSRSDPCQVNPLRLG